MDGRAFLRRAHSRDCPAIPLLGWLRLAGACLKGHMELPDAALVFCCMLLGCRRPGSASQVQEGITQLLDQCLPAKHKQQQQGRSSGILL